jgi:sialate O-acetylesterase
LISRPKIENGNRADAHIEGNTVVVSSTLIPNPKEVRYAWQSNPAATLFNVAGLRVAPFWTDSWPGTSESQKPY